jgi:CheY-like chemotaxis protein
MTALADDHVRLRALRGGAACFLAKPVDAEHHGGLIMLAFGWLALKFSLAWLANPLLILAFVVARPGGDPGSWRCLGYSALAAMLTLPLWKFKGNELLPVLPWLASAVLLTIGIELYRRAYRKALAQALQSAGPD